MADEAIRPSPTFAGAAWELSEMGPLLWKARSPRRRALVVIGGVYAAFWGTVLLQILGPVGNSGSSGQPVLTGAIGLVLVVAAVVTILSPFAYRRVLGPPLVIHEKGFRTFLSDAWETGNLQGSYWFTRAAPVRWSPQVWRRGRAVAVGVGFQVVGPGYPRGKSSIGHIFAHGTDVDVRELIEVLRGWYGDRWEEVWDPRPNIIQGATKAGGSAPGASKAVWDRFMRTLPDSE